jgi:hypothetical protein
MNIIEFIEGPRLIGDKSLSPAQKMALPRYLIGHMGQE